jgi:hypothetical protein
MQPHLPGFAPLSGQPCATRGVGYFFPPIRMDMISKKKKDVPSARAETAADPASGPVKVFRIEEVSASIFARTRTVQGAPVTFHSVSFSRSYKDAAGERKYTKNFDTEDLGAIVSLAQQASEYIHGLKGSAGLTV